MYQQNTTGLSLQEVILIMNLVGAYLYTLYIYILKKRTLLFCIVKDQVLIGVFLWKLERRSLERQWTSWSSCMKVCHAVLSPCFRILVLSQVCIKGLSYFASIFSGKNVSEPQVHRTDLETVAFSCKWGQNLICPLV